MLGTLNRLDTGHARLVDIVRSVDQPLIQRRPAENDWSVLEVVHHLCLVESAVLAQLKKSISSPTQPVSFIKKLLPLRIVSWRVIKVSAPKTVQPQNNFNSEQVLAKFDQARDNLKSFCEEIGERRLKKLSFKHPAFGNITGLAAVKFIGFHELRHLKQIREILRKLERTELK